MVLERRQVVVLESVRRFLRRSAHGHLLNLLAKIRPQDFGPMFEALAERERVALFRLLAARDAELGAELLVHLPHGYGPPLIRRLGAESGARLLSQCADDDAADLLASMEDEERQQLLAAMHPEEKNAVQRLLLYEEETAGRIMTPDVFSLRGETTIAEATESLRRRENVEIAFYLYVVDAENRLAGVVSLRELLMNRADAPLSEVMNTDLITVRADADQEEVARLASKYDLLAIPVVDENGHLVGAVTIDDVIDVLREEATEDILRMAGTSEEERIEPSILKSVRTRSPWLLATLLGGIAAAWIILTFSGTLQQMVVLAAFFPAILGIGGSAGNQAATVVIRGLATGRIREGLFLRTMLRESGTAGALGLLYGVLLVLASSAMLALSSGARGVDPIFVGAVVGISLAVSVSLATTLGALLPLLLHRVGLDPAVSTNPIVTTATDVLGSLIFLGLASLVLLR